MTKATDAELDYFKELIDKSKPLHCRVLVKMDVPELKTEGGIFLSSSTLSKNYEAAECGTIIAMGPTAFKDERICPPGSNPPQVGDKVYFGRYQGRFIELEDLRAPDAYSRDVKCRILNDEDIYLEFSEPLTQFRIKDVR